MDGRKLTRIVLITCLGLEVLFVLLDATINYARWTDYGMIRRLCNIAREDGLASWFSTIETWMVGLTLWLLFMAARRDRRPRWVVIGWLCLSLFFFYLAVDDGAQIHERVGSAFEKRHDVAGANAEPSGLGDKALAVFPSYAWQVVFMPFFAVMGLFMIFFLWRELGTGRAMRMIGLALILLVAGVALDFIEGLHEHHPWNVYTAMAEYFNLWDWAQAHYQRTPFDVLRHFSKSLEEFLEMLAMTLFWVAFLGHLTKVRQPLTLSFTPWDQRRD